jgi:cutinase
MLRVWLLVRCITAPLFIRIFLTCAVVVFGDPKRGQSFGSIATSKTLTICHTGDDICEGGTSITAAHLNYQKDAGTAATFVAGKV